MRISIIAATTDNNVIGYKQELPWGFSQKADLQKFKELTTHNAIIMGRKTHESIGRPLPNRLNIVLTNNPNYQCDGCIVVHNIDQALETAKEHNINEIFIIGGESLFSEALKIATRIYLTRIHTKLEGDTYFPDFQTPPWQKIVEDKHISDGKNLYDYTYEIYEKKLTKK